MLAMNDEEKDRLDTLAGGAGFSRQRYLQEVICSGARLTLTEQNARLAEQRASWHALERYSAALAEAADATAAGGADADLLSLLREAMDAAVRLRAALIAADGSQ
jgi:hypothetical protein